MIHNIKHGTMDWEFVFRDRCDMAASLSGVSTDLKDVRLKGDLAPLLDTCRPRIAIVGTRDCPPAAIGYIDQMLSPFTSLPEESRPIIISGLAMGTDTAVHRTALRYGLPTVAVVATGFDTVYPYCNRELAKEILNTPGCGILTQFPDQTAPIAINFLERNKTIALMADAIVIPAMKAKGGAMVTARIARDWEIPVYAVPGRPDDRWAEGCNLLIKHGLADMLCVPSGLVNDFA